MLSRLYERFVLKVVFMSNSLIFMYPDDKAYFYNPMELSSILIDDTNLQNVSSLYPS